MVEHNAKITNVISDLTLASNRLYLPRDGVD